MKFPSIQSMLRGITASFARFAPAIIAALIGTTAAFVLTVDFDTNVEYLYRFIFCAALGLPLFMAVRLFCEKAGTRFSLQIIYFVIAAALLIGYFFTLPLKVETMASVRFALLLIGVHLLVSFSAYTGRGEMNGFWQFNKAIFLRILMAALFSAVLYTGLSLAVLAIDKLFGADINPKVYLRLWIVIAGIFNTWFFLAGVPEHTETLENNTGFPKGLKIFTQYVLIPIVFIYLLILYAYTFKIIFTWHFPNGWVSYLVLYYSTAGIFSLLLIHPIKNTEGNGWINFISKWFYIVLLPMLVLLAIAICKRIDQYGVTENRYFIVVLNGWLAFISLYFILSKTKYIRIIPLTLCILAFLTCFGPWGAFSISQRSQFRQLERTLIEAKMLVKGKVQKAPEDLSFELGNRLVTIIDYLDKANALDKMKPWFKQDFDSLFKADTLRYSDKSAKILTLMGIDKWAYYYNNRDEGKHDSLPFSYYSTPPVSYIVKDFDYFINYNMYDYQQVNDISKHGKNTENTSFYALGKNDSLSVHFNRKNKMIELMKDNRSLIAIDISLVIEKIKGYLKLHPEDISHNNFPSEVMMTEKENDFIKTRIFFSQIGGNKKKKGIVNINNLNATILLKINSEK